MKLPKSSRSRSRKAKFACSSFPEKSQVDPIKRWCTLIMKSPLAAFWENHLITDVVKRCRMQKVVFEMEVHPCSRFWTIFTFFTCHQKKDFISKGSGQNNFQAYGMLLYYTNTPKTKSGPVKSWNIEGKNLSIGGRGRHGFHWKMLHKKNYPETLVF